MTPMRPPHEPYDPARHGLGASDRADAVDMHNARTVKALEDIVDGQHRIGHRIDDAAGRLVLALSIVALVIAVWGAAWVTRAFR